MFVERMAVEIEGEGEPVVMIHGLGGTSNTFTPVLAAFARHRTIRFDLPGSGRSHRVEGPLSLPLFVERTLLVMQRAGVERAHVVAGNFTFRGESATLFRADLQYTNRFLDVINPRVERASQFMTASNATVDIAGRRIFLTNGFSTMDPGVVTRAIGPKVAGLMEPYRFLQPPTASAYGTIPLTEGVPADLHVLSELSPVSRPSLVRRSSFGAVAPPVSRRPIGRRSPSVGSIAVMRASAKAT